MGSKNNPGKYDCYANAHPDEPMFVLLGRDPQASALVRKWARDREALRSEDREKVAEAFRCADAMQDWAEGCNMQNDFGGHPPRGAASQSVVAEPPRGVAKTHLRQQVEEFHRAFGQEVRAIPSVPPDEIVRLRLRLIFEEALEFLVATIGRYVPANVMALEKAVFECLKDVSIDVDLPQVVDALADLDYVVEGTRLALGVNGLPIAVEVHRSNMAKIGGKRRSDGKQLKPAGWTPPDIVGELKKQGWDEAQSNGTEGLKK